MTFEEWLEDNSERIKTDIHISGSSLLSFILSRGTEEEVAMEKIIFWEMGCMYHLEILPYKESILYINSNIAKLREEYDEISRTTSPIKG